MTSYKITIHLISRVVIALEQGSHFGLYCVGLLDFIAMGDTILGVRLKFDCGSCAEIHPHVATWKNLGHT